MTRTALVKQIQNHVYLSKDQKIQLLKLMLRTINFGVKYKVANSSIRQKPALQQKNYK